MGLCMRNNNIFIKYIVISIFAVVTGASCKSGIQVENLALPQGILEDAQAYYYKADLASVNKSYAEIDTGETVGDGFVLSDPTDAERILQAASGMPHHIFIAIPKEEAKAEHIKRSLSAASIRLAFHRGKISSIKTLNTEILQKTAADLNLDDVQKKSYFLSIAKKLNDQVSAQDVIIINLDELAVTPKEFMEQLGTPHIIGLSKQSIDHFAPFSEEAHQEFLALGLNPGHVYKITEEFVKRLNTNLDFAAQQELILTITKVISALEPNATLGSLAKLLGLLGNRIKKDSNRADLEQEIIKDLGQFYETSSKHIVNLDLKARTLTEIQEKTKENVLAFSESARKLDKIFKYSGKVGSTLATGFEEIRRNIAKNGASIDDLRNVDLPHMQQELHEQGATNRDEVIASTKRQLSAQAERLMADNAQRHEVTKKHIGTTTRAIVDDAREYISKDTADKMESMASVYSDALKNAMGKIVAKTTEQLVKVKNDIGQDTERTVKKAKGEINDYADLVSKEIVATLAGEMSLAQDELSKKVSSSLAKTESTLTKNAQANHDATRSVIKKNMTSVVGDAQRATQNQAQDLAEELKETVATGLTKAIQKISAGQAASVKGLEDGINANTDAAILRAQKILADALLDAEEQIKNKVQDEHEMTRDDIKNAFTQGLARVQTDLNADSVERHGQTQSIIKKSIDNAAKTHDATMEELDAKLVAMEQTIENRIQKAVSQMSSESARHMKDFTSATQNVIKKEHGLTKDQIQQAKNEVVKILQEEVANTLESIDKMPLRNRRHTAQIARKMVYVLSAYINGIRHFTDNKRQPIGDTEENVTPALLQQDLWSIQQAPRLRHVTEDTTDTTRALYQSIMNMMSTAVGAGHDASLSVDKVLHIQKLIEQRVEYEGPSDEVDTPFYDQQTGEI